jgi:hypothetical protein
MLNAQIKDDYLLVHNPTNNIVYTLKHLINHEFGEFYYFHDIMDMPFERKLMFDFIKQYETIGIDKSQVIKKLEEIQEEKDSPEKVWHVAEVTKAQIADYWDSYMSLQKIVSLIVVEKNDINNILTYNREIEATNLNKWRSDPELWDFFLTVAQSWIVSLSQKSKLPLQIYSEVQNMMSQKHTKDNTEQSSTIKGIFKSLFKK